MVDGGSDRQTSLISHEHDWLLERLHSLENCLDNILYFGEVCSDMRGFAGLLRRCRELQNTLVQHVPDEEEVFARLAGETELQPLLEKLKSEHRVMTDELDETVRMLEAVEGNEPLPENLFTLQDKLRRFAAFLQHHIATENLHVFPRLTKVA